MTGGPQNDSQGFGASARRAGSVVVADDGSHGAARAVAWATREATARGAVLRVLPEPLPSFAGLPAHGVDLLVVDGSVARDVPARLSSAVRRSSTRRGACPVALIRGRSHVPVSRIAVGYEGSSAAEHALEWAVDASRVHGCDIVVLHAWSPESADRSLRSKQLSAAEAESVLDRAVQQCRRLGAQTVTGQLVEADASTSLIEASSTSDLLVLGSRGRSGFRTILYGSVALALAQHSVCPVVITYPRAYVPVAT